MEEVRLKKVMFVQVPATVIRTRGDRWSKTDPRRTVFWRTVFKKIVFRKIVVWKIVFSETIFRKIVVRDN